jgi:AbrB family looped-hinge helix DNA binding protein
VPSAAVTSKGQVTIPKEVREHLGLAFGDRLDFLIGRGGDVVLRPATRDVTELCGLLHRPGRRRVSLAEMKRSIRRRVAGYRKR